INDASEVANGDTLIAFSDTASPSAKDAIPVLHLRRDVIDPVLQSAMKASLKEIEEGIDKELKPRSAVLEGWTADVRVDVKKSNGFDVKNVVGVVEGKGPLADETVVIGAHYDHLGYGGFGSLAKGSKEIHHGADDNGSGSTSVLELARRFGMKKDRVGR